MKFSKPLQIGLLVLGLIGFCKAGAQENQFSPIPLSDMQAFNNPGENWILRSNLITNFSEPWQIKKSTKGTGIVVNDLSKDHNSPLATTKEFGDVDLELDFMMDKGSNSGILLQGRYEIQLGDSWIGKKLTFADCGGIDQQWDESNMKKSTGGAPPLAEASSAPGLWQHLRIRFKAPRFDDNGAKISNARFEEVYLNGILVQHQVDVSGPTKATLFNDEKSTGPLVFQGDQGKVAFRNIGYNENNEVKLPQNDNPHGLIMVEPEKEPFLLRSFMMFNGKKLNYVMSVGTPQGLNYSYDLNQGALLQVWRGDFMDVTDMWHNRGESQLAQPIGNPILLSDNPSIAHLKNVKEEWPNAIEFEDLYDKSYILDQDGLPTFKYKLGNSNVNDKISLHDNGEGFSRSLKIENSGEDLYCKVVTSKKIEKIKNELYRIDGSYFVQLNKGSDPIIRSTPKGQEMLLLLDGSNTTSTYSIIW